MDREAPISEATATERWLFSNGQSRASRAYRAFRRDFFASDKADHTAILEYASGKSRSRR
jgi:hypothetical protein